MGKSKYILLAVTLILLLTGCSLSNPDYTPITPDPTSTSTESPAPTETSTPEPTATETPTEDPVPSNFWASGLKVEDITNSTSRMCSYDMCVFLKLTALKTCSSITLEGLVYDENDNEVDDFSDELPRLAKGKTRVVEFGTDATEDTDAEVDLDTATCWK